MDAFSIWHWLVVLLVVVLLFGGGKVSGLMGDLAKGIKAFKKNMASDEDAPAPGPAREAGPAIGDEARPQPGAPTAGAAPTATPKAEERHD
ncbi:MAG: twin-arginine translocase TatA/TatE family subunit [Rhodospirillales bacterium]|nr:twin-arginine translocase TatA/TatE family subunit [Rhodospirillales bacterium]